MRASSLKIFCLVKMLCAFFGESLITFSEHFISIGSVTRIELCILVKICNRPMIIAQIFISIAAIVVSVGKIRIEFDSFVVILNRSLVLSVLIISIAAI